MWLVTCSSFCLTISGFQALKELGIEIDVYCASEIDEQAMQVGIERLFRMKSLAINFSTPPPPPNTTLTKQFSWLCTTWRNKAGSLKVNYVVIPGHDNSLTPLCWFNGKTFVKEFTRLIPDILDYNLEGLSMHFLCIILILQVAKVHHGIKIHHIGDIKGISRDKVMCLCCLASVSKQPVLVVYVLSSWINQCKFVINLFSVLC